MFTQNYDGFCSGFGPNGETGFPLGETPSAFEVIRFSLFIIE